VIYYIEDRVLDFVQTPWEISCLFRSGEGMKRGIPKMPIIIMMAYFFISAFYVTVLLAAEFNPGIPVGAKIPQSKAGPFPTAILFPRLS
jgi:hypothetical protein